MTKERDAEAERLRVDMGESLVESETTTAMRSTTPDIDTDEEILKCFGSREERLIEAQKVLRRGIGVVRRPLKTDMSTRYNAKRHGHTV